MQPVRGAREGCELLPPEVAGADLLRGDLRLLRKDAGDELLRGHFEAEDRHRRPRRLGRLDSVGLVLQEPFGGGERHVGRQRRLAHSGPPGDDDQVRALQPADARVEAGEAGGDPGEAASAVERGLGVADRGHRRLAERLGLAFGAAFLGNLVELGLGLLDLHERGDLLAGVERALDEVPPHPNEGAQQSQIVNLLGEIAGADDRGARAGELGEIGRTADLLHRLVALEQWLQGHRVRDPVRVGHPEDRFVDSPVQRLEEMVRLQFELDVLDQPVVDHQCAQKRGLRLDILRQRL